MWVRLEADGTARVGGTHLVALHGQLMMFTPRPAGSVIQRDRSMGVMETAKTAVAIHAPLSCRVIESNAAVVRDIDIAVNDPYGAGWLFHIEPTNLEAERGALMDVEAYRAWVEPRLADKLAPPAAGFIDDFDADPHGGY